MQRLGRRGNAAKSLSSRKVSSFSCDLTALLEEMHYSVTRALVSHKNHKGIGIIVPFGTLEYL